MIEQCDICNSLLKTSPANICDKCYNGGFNEANWNPFPETNPNKNNEYYLVTVNYDHEQVETKYILYKHGDFIDNTGHIISDLVSAWMVMPPPYQKDE